MGWAEAAVKTLGQPGFSLCRPLLPLSLGVALSRDSNQNQLVSGAGRPRKQTLKWGVGEDHLLAEAIRVHLGVTGARRPPEDNAIVKRFTARELRGNASEMKGPIGVIAQVFESWLGQG